MKPLIIKIRSIRRNYKWWHAPLYILSFVKGQHTFIKLITTVCLRFSFSAVGRMRKKKVLRKEFNMLSANVFPTWICRKARGKLFKSTSLSYYSHIGRIFLRLLKLTQDLSYIIMVHKSYIMGKYLHTSHIKGLVWNCTDLSELKIINLYLFLGFALLILK